MSCDLHDFIENYKIATNDSHLELIVFKFRSFFKCLPIRLSTLTKYNVLVMYNSHTDIWIVSIHPGSTIHCTPGSPPVVLPACMIDIGIQWKSKYSEST